MDRPQTFGLLIIAGSVLEMLIFLYGVVRRSYMAVAIPVLGALTAINLLAIWVGWTMLTTEPEMSDLEELEQDPAEI